MSQPSSPPLAAAFNIRAPSLSRGPGSLAQHQQQDDYLMLKTAQRNVDLPSLSLTIPQEGGDGKRGIPMQVVSEVESQFGKETLIESLEPLPKQVKFLSPDEDGDDQDGDSQSEQSSICQSPSWEGYGQKKREKKLEAERKRKEKERQDREAKAGKKRFAGRLSKAPPRPSSNQASALFTNAELSRSDPLLMSRRLASADPFSRSAADIERDTEFDETTPRAGSPANDYVISDSMDRNFVGGVKLEHERHSTLQNALTQRYLPQDPSFSGPQHGVKPRESVQKSQPMGSAVAAPSSAPVSSAVKDAKPSRDACPPSASRTPLLRQVSTTAHSRSNSLLNGANKMFRGRERSNSQQGPSHANNSQESLQTVSSNSERGRQQDGYVRRHRDQSKDRAMAGLADDQLSNGAALSTASSKNASRPVPSRRPSLTLEAKSIAMRLTGMRPSSESRDGGKGHTRSHSSVDYFTFAEQPHLAPELEALSPIESISASTKEKVGSKETAGAEESKAEPAASGAPPAAARPRETIRMEYIFPTTSLQPVSVRVLPSKTPSIASTSSVTSRKARSFKEAALAALSIHRGSLPPTPLDTPMPKSPTFGMRSRMNTGSHGTTSVAHISSAPLALSPPLATLQLPPKAARVLGEFNQQASQPGQPASDPSKTASLQPLPGSRVSEGSSSSSAYDDASPPLSPATTPNTSRPQSAKGLPTAPEEISKDAFNPPVVQDDERTVREAPHSSRSSTRTGTPRIRGSDSRPSSDVTEEEEWSRTALPLDLDFDAQSFVTSFSNLDHVDSIDEELARVRQLASSPRAELLAAHVAKLTKEAQEKTKMAVETPDKVQSLSKALSNPDLQVQVDAQATLGSDLGTNGEFSIPPRSKKRELVAKRPSTSPTDSQTGERGQAVTEKTPKQPALKTFRELELKQQERNSRPKRSEIKLERTRETTRRQSRVSEPPSSPRDDTHKPKRQHRKEQLRDVAREDESKVSRMKRRAAEVESDDTDPAVGLLNRPSTASSVASTSSSIYSNRLVSAPTLSTTVTVRKASSAPASAAASPKSAAFPPDVSSARQPKSPSLSGVRQTPPSEPQEITSHPRSMASSLGTEQTTNAASKLKTSSSSVPPAGAPGSRVNGSVPVSILKQTQRPQSPPPPQAGSSQRGPTLSAIPKHMQVQAGTQSRNPMAVAEQRVTPIAKMFVECCNCKFYHDMPSKLYECMAKPDAVVEDKLLGISGAITTMVKCPWCQHNMTTQCCAGYAAVVYLKERMH